jgi:hypothetical protein
VLVVGALVLWWEIKGSVIIINKEKMIFLSFNCPKFCQFSTTNDFWLMMIVGKFRKSHDRVEIKRA